MNRLWLISFLLLVFSDFYVEAQNYGGQNETPSEDAVSNFKPSLSVVIGILCVMFSLTFILLMYAKFCHRRSSSYNDQENNPALIRSTSRFSGIDKTVIESLPFFRFSSLKGAKQGLECAVCLSKFEDIEILRLLPKCKHAFHINCIDQWLEKHSSCPLCRHKVNPEDPTIFAYSNSMRFLLNASELREDPNIELYVQREEDGHQGSSRFSVGSSFRKIKEKETNNEERMLIVENDGAKSEDDQKLWHKFNHKIIVCDAILKNRWSNVSSSDLMLLNSEMLNVMSSNRFSNFEENNSSQVSTPGGIENKQIKQIKEEIEMKRLFEIKVGSMNRSGSCIGDASGSDSKAISTSQYPGRRSVSEITGLSRFPEMKIKNRITETFDGNERRRRVWLPIAKRTVQWFADREKRSPQIAQKTLDV
ncbi:E3 ubiquitin-protein ligase ATL42-like [Mangifera indica]|uniref:E3 ubiquitin-protein ligase ATL42-like n=1 Tax=Mangifera indica TaxID=29780 RepID=UPI001CF9FD61|nr:E3 ubiquitin-protein ligase ATL42-like [Mangifera indica]